MPKTFLEAEFGRLLWGAGGRGADGVSIKEWEGWELEIKELDDFRLNGSTITNLSRLV